MSLETDYDEEVSDLLAEHYTLWKAIRILIREVESPGTADFTALVALLDASEAAAVVTMGYYPITATPDAGNVVAAGGTKAITVAAAGDYTVVCPDGCTADITSGTPSDTTVTITVDANTGEERTFGIQFFSGNMEPVTADITQDDGTPTSISADVDNGTLVWWYAVGGPITGVDADPYTPTGTTLETAAPTTATYLGNGYTLSAVNEVGGGVYQYVYTKDA